MRALILTGFILIGHLINAQSTLPEWGRDRLGKHANLYALTTYANPQFLEADFSGDSVNDLAILIERNSDKKKGILILFGQSNRSFVIGAGNKIGNGGDDFSWLDKWSVFKEKETYETTFKPDGDVEGGRKIVLERQAISISEEEGSGGLVYFNGKQFIWIHQGD